MDVRVLGPVEVTVEGRPVAIGAGKPRALLAMLALNAGSTVSADRLIDGLWGEPAPATAGKMVQVYVSQLRKALPAGDDAAIVTRARGYELQLGRDDTDVRRFERLVAEGAPRDALRLWRGPALDDVSGEPFAAAEIRRLEELRLAAVEDAIQRDLDAGRHRDVIGELEALVGEEPLRERLHAQRMLALYRCGRQADALEAYRRARAALVEQIGIEPGPELRRLQQAILDQDPSLEPSPSNGHSETAREPPPRSVFVGRAPELAELVAGLDDAFAGRGRLFLLVGEPGIGKSRLAEELIAHARARGARVLIGRCWEAGGAPVYWPWVQSLRAYVRETEPDVLRAQLGARAADLAQIVPELHQLFPGLPEAAAVESEGVRFQLFDAAAEFLRNAAAQQPLLLFLDDLHAADASSLLLLQFVARELGPARILVLGACRDVDPVPAPALVEMLAAVSREPLARRLSLGGLSPSEVAELVERTAAEIASPVLVAAVHEGTEGNPLFAGEIVQLLSVEGTAESGLAIPESVRGVIARRLTHLSEECNRVLTLASVVGREFSLDAVAQLGDVADDRLLDLLDEATAARVVSDVPGAPGRVRFAHVLIRDTLYDSLTGPRRLRLHQQVVDALETLYGERPGPHLAELAHHAMAGQDADKGVRYAQLAGDRALALLAYEEASRLYGTALGALAHGDAPDESLRCELLLSFGEAESRAGNTAGAKAALVEAARIARRLGLPRQLARAAAEYGGRIIYARAGDDEHVLPLLEEGLAALPDDDVELRIRLLARLAGALRDEPSRARRDELSREAVDLARRSGDAAALAYALDGRAIAILGPDTVAEIAAIGAELCDVAERIGDRERVVHGLMHRAGPLLMLGKVAEAEADLAAASRIADELKQPAHLWDVGGAAAMLALAAGRLDEAEELVERAHAIGERAEPEMAMPVHRVQRYALCDFGASLEEIEPAIRDLVAARPARPVFRCLLVHLHARLGRTEEAKRALDDLVADGVAALPFDHEWLFGMSLLAETSALLGDAASAPLLYELMEPWAALNVVDQCEGIRGSAHRYLGLLAATTERWEEAERHYRDAIAMNERLVARPWVAHTQADYARMQLARGGPGDAERAKATFDMALATYRDLGMAGSAASASALYTAAERSRERWPSG